MVDFIINLVNGDKFHLKTEYKRVTVHNRMSMLYYIEQFSQVSRYDIKNITKATEEEVKGCSLVITVNKSMVQRFNAQ
jgi:hypothetical protein